MDRKHKPAPMMTIPIQSASAFNIRIVLGGETSRDVTENSGADRRVVASGQKYPHQQTVVADVHSASFVAQSPYGSSPRTPLLESSQSKDEQLPVAIVKPTSKTDSAEYTQNDVVISEAVFIDSKHCEEQPVEKDHLHLEKTTSGQNSAKKRVTFTNEISTVTDMTTSSSVSTSSQFEESLKENYKTYARRTGTGISECLDNASVEVEPSVQKRLSLNEDTTNTSKGILLPAKGPTSSFEESLKENYKTYARRTGNHLTEARDNDVTTDSSAIAVTDATTDKLGNPQNVAEAVASLMLPQETRIRINQNVRVALLQTAKQTLMLKIICQTGVVGIMEPSVYSAIEDIALTCALVAEKTRPTAAYTVILDEAQINEMIADKRFERLSAIIKDGGLRLWQVVCVFEGDKLYIGSQANDVVYRKESLTVAKSAVTVLLKQLNRLSPVQEFAGQVCAHVLASKPLTLGETRTYRGPASLSAPASQPEDQLLAQKLLADPLITVAEAARRSFVEIVHFTLYG